MNDAYAFGYPKRCEECRAIEKCSLNVKPFLKEGAGRKLMLVGQDPRIRNGQDRVNTVLMLDDPNSRLYRWLDGFLPIRNKTDTTIYATNAVKCTLQRVATDRHQGGIKYLEKFFMNCRKHLKNEIAQFQPDIVLTFGEPVHQLFREIVEDSKLVPEIMKDSFSGNFEEISVAGYSFLYSPCLHIQTFRVAETYGKAIYHFKRHINKFLNGDSK